MGKRKASDASDASDDRDVEHDSSSESEPQPKPKPKKLKKDKEVQKKTIKAPKASKGKSVDTADKASEIQTNKAGEQYLELGKKRRVTVRSFKGHILIDIREFYEDKASGEQKPGQKGVSLSLEQWNDLKAMAGKVDEIIESTPSK